jgi:hypothetical protein
MKEIIVSSKGGKVRIETKGFKGGACLKETLALEADLHLEKESDEKTPEYHQAVVTEAEHVKH